MVRVKQIKIQSLAPQKPIKINKLDSGVSVETTVQEVQLDNVDIKFVAIAGFIEFAESQFPVGLQRKFFFQRREPIERISETWSSPH